MLCLNKVFKQVSLLNGYEPISFACRYPISVSGVSPLKPSGPSCRFGKFRGMLRLNGRYRPASSNALLIQCVPGVLNTKSHLSPCLQGYSLNSSLLQALPNDDNLTPVRHPDSFDDDSLSGSVQSLQSFISDLRDTMPEHGSNAKRKNSRNARVDPMVNVNAS